MAAVAASRPHNNRPTTRVSRRAVEEEKRSLWSDLLESVGSSKRLEEKTLLVLGGTIETQTNYLEALSHDPSQRRPPAERPGTKKLPIANRFALGYTYQDVLEADQDDVLARLSEYLLVACNPSFTILLPPLFTVKSIPGFATTILLDWGEPWHWLRQLRDWIRALRTVLDSIDDDVRDALDENTQHWKHRRKGPKLESASSAYDDAGAPMSLGPGEYDEPLGVPVCVVCQNAEKIEVLEREHGWKDEEFDTVLIYLRTILLKHGGSLIYTASAAPGSLQKLVRGVLDIHSLLQRDPLKHNVNDRDKVLVPPNWDSWGKIRPLREDVNFEAISAGWSLDIQTPSSAPTQNTDPAAANPESLPEGSALAMFAALIPNPHETTSDPSTPTTPTADDLELHCPSNQTFLATQLPLLEAYKAEDAAAAARAKARKAATAGQSTKDSPASTAGAELPDRVREHIGPVQFNMGGIQVDADVMLQRIKDRESGREKERDALAVASSGAREADGDAEEEAGEPSNEHLRSFFASLAKKGGGSSASNSPRGERS